MTNKKPAPSLELTNAEGDQQPSTSGSYVRKDGELVKTQGTEVVSPFGGNTRFIGSGSVEASEPVVQEKLSQTDSEKVDQLVDEVVTAIGLVDPQDSSLWTSKSGPKMEVLENLVGQKLSTDTRTIAWTIYQENQEK